MDEEVEEVADVGERLPGGNVGGAWRVGDTVRRATGPWSPSVHALLRHLDGRLRCVPRVHGIDAMGREILDFLPGRIVDVDADELTDAQLVEVVRWLRDLHAATADFDHPGPWRLAWSGEVDVVSHGDLAPYNLVFDGDTLAGVFDWDVAGPTTVRAELGFVAWTCVPLFRPMPAAWCASRLRLIAETYGGSGPVDVLEATIERTRSGITAITRAAAAGDVGLRSLMTIADEPARTRRALAGLEERRELILTHLT